MNVRTFDGMLGVTMIAVTGDKGAEEMRFLAEDGRVFRFFHSQDCCENVQVEDVCGDLSDLVGSPIVEAEEVSNDDAPACDAESYTWTFYRFGTAKGSVTVRWLGTSNGYYGEGVDFYTIAAPTCQAHDDCIAYPKLGRACFARGATDEKSLAPGGVGLEKGGA